MPLRDIVVTIQAPPPVPPNVVLTAPRGEWAQEFGVNHVVAFAPVTKQNGGPGANYPYKILAVLAGNGQAIEFNRMWWGGTPVAGGARFADGG